jgi:LytS/YehU family sensor histidine kinase
MKNIPKYILWLCIICVIMALSTIVNSSEGGTLASVANVLLWSAAYTFPLGLGHAYMSKWLNEKYDWYSETKKRVFFGFIYSVVYSLMISFLVMWVMLVLPGKMDASEMLSPWAISRHYTTTLISLIISAFFHLRGFLMEWKEKTQQLEALKRQKLEAELAVLQQQLDSHFLFNSLSVLREIIQEDTEMAMRFVDDFSQVYRYIVQNNQQNTVALSDELDFIRKYISLHQSRFENAIQISFELEEKHQQMMIIPLAVQIAVENAIRHNIFNASEVLKIEIFCKDDGIYIRNNLNKKSQSKGNNMALKNLNARFLILANESIKIEQNKSYYQIKFPLLTA